MNIEYIRDSDVDTDMDRSLRELLSLCFTNPGGEIFRERRYYKEPPLHRWFIQIKEFQLVAHVALHEMVVKSSHQPIKAGGIAEVCVHPEFRRQGLVRELLAKTHDWLRSNDYPFSLLSGYPSIYTSSGYVSITNLLEEKTLDNGSVNWEPMPCAMVCQLLDTHWPDDPVYLPGKSFLS
jgi:GNAT superfamily N-acetyltransferase